MSKNTLIAILIIALIILIGTLFYLFMIIMEGNTPVVPDTNQNINQPVNLNINTNQPATPSAEIANPAAVKCEEDGGVLESYQTADGKAALCIFDDNSICNQWDYFKGDCQPGQCFKVCDQENTKNEGWYNSCTDQLIEPANCTNQKEENQQEKQTNNNTQKSIKLNSPQENQQLSSPFTLEGSAIVKDNKVYIRVKNLNDQVLIEESVTAAAQPGSEWAEFSIDIEYDFQQTKEGYIEVYSYDDQNNEINNISIPVKF